MSDKTLGDYSKDRAARRQKEILSLIDTMKKNKEKITFYSVAKRGNASKSYLYKNTLIHDKIVGCRAKQESSEAVIVKSTELKELKRRVRMLEKEVKNLHAIKERYEIVLTENQSLKDQLRVAYSYFGKDK